MFSVFRIAIAIVLVVSGIAKIFDFVPSGDIDSPLLVIIDSKAFWIAFSVIEAVLGGLLLFNRYLVPVTLIASSIFSFGLIWALKHPESSCGCLGTRVIPESLSAISSSFPMIHVGLNAFLLICTSALLLDWIRQTSIRQSQMEAHEAPPLPGNG